MMKLILTSSNNYVVKDWIQYIDRDPKTMKVTFIFTAAEVEKGDMQWLDDDRQALVDVGFNVIDYTLTGKTKVDVEKMLSETDMVFVSGGNTFYLLQEMRKSGFVDLIRSHVEKGLVYGGSSAGSVVAGPDISVCKQMDDPLAAPELTSYEGLGLTDVVTLPHWGSEHFAERYPKTMLDVYKEGLKIMLLTNQQYLLVEDDMYRILSV